MCVIDSRSRTLTADQREALDALRRQVESQLQLRLNLIELEEALSARDRAEAEQAATMSELRAAHENVRRLSALMLLCSTCQFTMTIYELMDHVQFADGGREVQMRKKKAPDLTPASR